MKKVNLLLFGMLTVTMIFLNSCKKDDSGITLEGTYAFDSISTGNTIYAFKRENGAAVPIAQEDIDMSIFDESNQVQIVDNIQILSNSRLSYAAYDIWSSSTTTRTVESDYSIDGQILDFTFTDEFSNDDLMKVEIEGDQLILNTYVYATKWTPGFQPLDFYFRPPNLVLSEEDALNRLGADEGDEIYLMLYQQRYQ